jgi:protease YdgD
MVAAGPAMGEGGRRVAVDAGQAPWSSLVRVQAPGLTRCTGVLLAPDRVATAAHCLFSARLGHFIPPGSVNVLLAHAHGSHAGHAVALRYATAPGFDPRQMEATRGADVAVIVLASPLRGPVLAVAEEIGPAAVAVGGYQRDRPEVLTADLGCRILAQVWDQGGRGLLAHDCAAISGSSGAPVLRRSGGTWQVIGIQVGARPDGPGGMAVPAAALRGLLEGR